MTSFLSTISGQFAKNILIGTLFPVVLFVMAITAVVLPLADVTPHVAFGLIFPWEVDSTVAALTVFVLITTVLLFALNIPLIRLYEGYPWQNSWLGQWRTKDQRRRARLLQQVRERARLLTRQTHEANVSNALPPDFSTLLNRSGQARSSFPVKETSILPTRLGNVIRAFEGYPMLKYGIDAIILWPRLAQKLPKEVQEALDDAKASFDFMLNCSVLSAVSAVAEMTTGLIRHHSSYSSYAGTWLLWTTFFLALSYLFYLGAINRAASWGTEVKVAFDLYRFELLSALGYKIDVSGPKEERALWEEISYQLLYPDAPNLPKLPYKTGQTSLGITPMSVVVTAERSISWLPNHIVAVLIEVKNDDKFRHEANSVEVSEKIAKGLRVVEDSVKIEGVPAPVRSLDPLVVGVGPLKPDEKKRLTYSLQKN
jgi:hypothetical protein